MLAVVVVGGAVAASKQRERHQDSARDEASGTVSAPTWIGSGRYELPNGIPPGLYRVGRHYKIYDQRGAVVNESPATVEGTTLLIVRPDAPAGTVEIVGGAWPLIADGPVDPTRFRDGTYLVGYDIQPGTYQVAIIPRGGGVASVTRLTERYEVIQTEQVSDSDPIDSVVIVVEPTDFGVSFSGQISKID